MAITDNLIAWWKLDESSGDAADVLGSITMTNVGTLTYTTGKLGNCWVFSSGKYLSATHTAAMNVSTGFTIMAWVKSSNASEQYIATKGTDTSWNNSRHFATWISVADWKVNLNLTGVGGWFKWATNVCDNNWHHVAATYNGSNWYIYVDGAQDGTGSTSGSISTSTAALNIWARLPDTSYAERWGNIDDVYYFSRALSLSEIQQIYNSGTGIAYPFVATNSWAFFAFF